MAGGRPRRRSRTAARRRRRRPAASPAPDDFGPRARADLTSKLAGSLSDIGLVDAFAARDWLRISCRAKEPLLARRFSCPTRPRAGLAARAPAAPVLAPPD